MEAIQQDFVHHIERRGAWRLLYNDDETARDEPNVQPLLWFISAIVRSCGIHMDREVETGLGPVDFKFGSLTFTAHLELKKSSGEWRQGLKSQLPTYLEADRVNEAIYIVLRLDDIDDATWTEHHAELEGIRNDLQAQGYSIEVVWVDARRPLPASRRRES